MSKIECIGYKASPSGTLQGFADFRVPKWGVELFGCGVFMKEGRRWISLPQRKYEESGETKYCGIMKFIDKEHSRAFSKILLDELDEYCKRQAPQLAENQQPFEGDRVPF